MNGVRTNWCSMLAWYNTGWRGDFASTRARRSALRFARYHAKNPSSQAKNRIGIDASSCIDDDSESSSARFLKTQNQLTRVVLNALESTTPPERNMIAWRRRPSHRAPKITQPWFCLLRRRQGSGRNWQKRASHLRLRWISPLLGRNNVAVGASWHQAILILLVAESSRASQSPTTSNTTAIASPAIAPSRFQPGSGSVILCEIPEQSTWNIAYPPPDTATCVRQKITTGSFSRPYFDGFAARADVHRSRFKQGTVVLRGWSVGRSPHNTSPRKRQGQLNEWIQGT